MLEYNYIMRLILERDKKFTNLQFIVGSPTKHSKNSNGTGATRSSYRVGAPKRKHQIAARHGKRGQSPFGARMPAGSLSFIRRSGCGQRSSVGAKDILRRSS